MSTVAKIVNYVHILNWTRPQKIILARIVRLGITVTAGTSGLLGLATGTSAAQAGLGTVASNIAIGPLTGEQTGVCHERPMRQSPPINSPTCTDGSVNSGNSIGAGNFINQGNPINSGNFINVNGSIDSANSFQSHNIFSNGSQHIGTKGAYELVHGRR